MKSNIIKYEVAILKLMVVFLGNRQGNGVLFVKKASDIDNAQSMLYFL